MSGTGNRSGARATSRGIKQVYRVTSLSYLTGIAGAVGESRKVPPQVKDTLKPSSRELRLPYSGRVSPAAKGLTSKEKALLIFHEGGTKFPPRPAGRKEEKQ